MDVWQELLLEQGIVEVEPIAPLFEEAYKEQQIFWKQRGVTVPDLVKNKENRIEYRCCGQPLEYYDQEGFLTCFDCGKVHHYGAYEIPHGQFKNGSLDVKSFTMTIHQRRFYKPLTHFKEHIRRYLGARFREIPESLVTRLKEDSSLNVLLPNAYFEVKKRLRQWKFQKWYREIFTLIYECGGIKPHITNEQYHGCIHQFMELYQQFERQRLTFQRHSMPSMYILMDQLLREQGHHPHYQIPYLKDRRLLENVMHILHTLRNDEPWTSLPKYAQ